MLGLGIERLEEELKKIKTETPLTFKKVDSELEPEKIKEIIDDFNNHKFDILLGTEIILRPQLKPVSLVSVVSIDALFTFPDFQQEEKILKYLINLKNKSLNQFIIQTIFKDQNVFQVIRNDNIKDFLKQNLEIKKHYN
jgi:primosomal protein N' (replication factor Y)